MNRARRRCQGARRKNVSPPHYASAEPPDGSLTNEPAEPVAVDLRPGQDGRRLTRLKRIARPLDVGLDDLVRRDAQRRQTQLIIAARDEARVQRGQAEGLVEFMVGDLQEKLEPKVRLDVLSSVADRAIAYCGVQFRYGMDADALGRRSRVLAMLGWIEQDKGDCREPRRDCGTLRT